MRAGRYVVIPPGRNNRSQTPPPPAPTSLHTLPKENASHFLKSLSIQTKICSPAGIKANDAKASDAASEASFAARAARQSACITNNQPKPITTMAKETKAATKAATSAATKEREVIKLTAKVVRVGMFPDDPNRVSLITDAEFETIDKKTGEVLTTNSFGLDTIALVSQVSQFVPEIQLAETLALGARVNPQIIALAMLNANITFERQFREKGEEREYKQKNKPDVYTADCWTTKITSCSTNINPVFANMLMQLITTKPAVVAAVAMPNPFNV